MNCTQPGCTGQIEDGYCNVCGSPAPAAARAAVPVGGAAGGAASGGGARSAAAPATPPGGIAGVGSTRTASSGSLASAPLGSARGGTRATRRLGSTSTRLRGARLGQGITTVPTEPVVDPGSAIMAVPEVPEDRRVCPNCGSPVGRSRAGRPGRTEGFCPNCRAPFSFSPKLKPGDLVGGQYEVAGCLAHGGLGWIYLAKDKNVSDRWVVLKGLLNSGDPDALAAAIAERQFLAQVEHPLIVEIYNFVTHDEAGYIVMEYVGGKSLKNILKSRMAANNGRFDPVPVDQAIAYVLEALPAFQYLHDLDLLYCDFKPDNLIQAGDAVKLIDLGGVRRVDDLDSAIYGTVGYQAPEVPEVGPSVASDIYTIGRTLVSLATEFRGNTSTYVDRLPPVADVPLFQRYDSLYRLLLKACARDADDRFVSADELRVQLLGVLREVVALDRRGDQPAAHSTASALFEAPVVESDTLTWHNLPALRVDETDPQAAWLDTVSVTEPEKRLAALQRDAPERTVEVQLATALAAVEAQRHDVAATVVSEILADDPWEWRAVWVSGIATLAAGDPAQAQAAFNAVYGQVPGELAPKLALALACEQGGQPDVAEQLYLACLRTDANYTAPAAFGLARIRAERKAQGQGELRAAIAALDMVPPTSRSYVAARRQRAELLVQHGHDVDAYAAALDSVEGVSLDARELTRLRIDVLRAALDDVSSKAPRPGVRVGGVPADPDSLRDGLEHAYREMAGMTERREERVRLVDSANRVRRWTLR
jgi:serine/threonine-protein kinase PknG